MEIKVDKEKPRKADKGSTSTPGEKPKKKDVQGKIFEEARKKRLMNLTKNLVGGKVKPKAEKKD